MLQISSLSYRIKDSLILDRLTLTIEAGHYFALAGENGAGKSTLIKIILDLIRNIQSGTVTIDGISSRQVAARNNLSGKRGTPIPNIPGIIVTLPLLL